MADPQVTQILAEVGGGDVRASEKLLPIVYEELRRLARQKMSQEAAGHTLQPTALVHEAYLRLVGDGAGRKWDSRGHFYAAAAEAMRRILIESARRKAGLKHGGGQSRVPLPDDLPEDSLAPPDSILTLNEALVRLHREDNDLYRLVMLRYFGGLTIEETATALGISQRTAKRHWSFARAWLKREMGPDAAS
ncbi:MAG TPA: sigma-70 family RNA polymerase sigma factor [Pirellulales bacterium]|jgi:RNA polymerase sigma factor (TIGR02999 family)|nr:sigma-70 family RNA polymerase sigma factor [Pirellulales bacterium]